MRKREVEMRSLNWKKGAANALRQLAWDNFVDWFESSSALPSPNNRWFIVFSFWELDFSIKEFEKRFLMLFVYWSFLVWDSAFESENRRAAFFEQESNFGFIFEGKNGRRRVCGAECAGTRRLNWNQRGASRTKIDSFFLKSRLILKWQNETADRCGCRTGFVLNFANRSSIDGVLK